MEKIGEITAADRGMLEVTFCRPEDCGHCHACEGGQKPTVLHLSSQGHSCSVGDFAEVELPTGTVVKASLLAYALPVAGLMGGMALGSLSGNAMAAIGGAIGLCACLAVVFLTEKKRRNNPKWQPTLVRVIPRTWLSAKTENETEEQTA